MPTALQPRPTAPTVRIDRAGRRIALQHPRVFGEEGACARFVERVLALDEVRGVEVDRHHGSATIRHRAAASDVPRLLRAIAEALRGEAPPRRPLALPRVSKGTSFVVYRHQAIASTWEILHDAPGRLTLRHDVLRDDRPRADRVAAAIAEVPGVRRARVGHHAGSVLVLYEPLELNPARLVRLAEEMLEEPAPWGPLPPPPAPTRFTLANTAVGVSAAGQFLLPALLPVSAALLIGMNIGTLKETWRELKRKHVGLASLYATIIATTLASGQFFSAALMYWTFQFWYRRYRESTAIERRRLLAEALPRPRFARLRIREGTEALVGPETLKPGDAIVVGPEDVVPADARVLDGEAMVDESGLTGIRGAVRKRRGARLLAGSVVLAGEANALVETVGDRTRAALLSRALLDATSPPAGSRAPTREAQAFAEKTVGPTLTLAGLGGLVTGDLNTVGAILRPDYATGPGLSVSLESLGAVGRGLGHGALIRHPEILDRLTEVDVIAFEDSPALRRAGVVVDRVVTRLDEALFFRLAASTFRHVADDRAAALERACRDRGGHLVQVEPVDLRNGVTAVIAGNRIRVRDSGPALGDEYGLVVEVDETPIGLIRFRAADAPAAVAPILGLRDAAPRARLSLLSDRPSGDLAAIAAALGVDDAFGGLDGDAKGRFLRVCRAKGLRVAFVGDCRNTPAAAEATVAIHLGDEPDVPAAVQLLGGRFDGLDALWRIAGDHARGVREGRLGVVLPNLFCVAGAFFLGFGGLHTVVISNLGTLGAYARASAGVAARGVRKRGRIVARGTGETHGTAAPRA